MTTATIFGEVLFDLFPDGSRILGGAPFNVGWHLQAFGLAPQFVSRIGCDDSGRFIQAAMAEWGMTIHALQQDTQHPTGTVAVTLSNGEPAYAILEQQAYDFIAPAELTTGALLYHGSLALRAAQSLQALTVLKAVHRGLVFMDVNLRAPWWQFEAIHQQLREADWVKLNDEEWQLLFPECVDLEAAMQAALQRYGWQGVVVTQGERGAIALNQAGEKVQVSPHTLNAVVDTVGAGDAFSAVLLLGLLKAWPLALTMTRAQDFASALVGQRGATVHERAFYQPFIRDWAL